MNKYNLVIIDLDKTIIYGDSIVAFSKVLMDEGLLDFDFWVKKNQLDYDNNYFSLIKKQKLFNIYIGLDEVLKKKIIGSFLFREEINVINDVIAVINKYRSRNFKILVTTASLDFLVFPLLEKINFSYDFLHCSSFYEVTSEKVKLKLNNSGISKLQCIKDHFISIGRPEEIVVFTDHFSDLPLLLIGNTSFVVKNRANKNDDWTVFFDFPIIFHDDF